MKGLFLDMSIRRNISAMDIHHVSTKGFIDRKKEDRQAKKLTEKLKVKYSTLAQDASSLSGGISRKC